MIGGNVHCTKDGNQQSSVYLQYITIPYFICSRFEFFFADFSNICRAPKLQPTLEKSAKYNLDIKKMK